MRPFHNGRISFFLGLAASVTVCAHAEERCANLAQFRLSGAKVLLTKAESLPAGPLRRAPTPSQGPGANLPAYCRVEGVINQRTTAGGKTYGIGFAVALPQNWTGEFLFQGGGGLNGLLNDPIGAVAAGDRPALSRGIAVASTDSGHRSKAAFDSSFFADQQATLDFEYASIGAVTAVAKQIIAAYYGRLPEHSYFTGCSMGGREAMIAAQRYPLEFDGAISGAPAMRVGYSGIGDRWVAVTLNQIAPKTADGKPIPGGAFSPNERLGIIKSLLDACDDKDGIRDGMIFDVSGCKYDPAMLLCAGAKADSCLSPAQVGALQKAFAGPRDAKGKQVYPGFYYDTGIANERGIPGLLATGRSPLGPPNLDTEIDVDAAAAAAALNAAQAVGDTAGWTNMNSFVERGGKLIFFHGVSDPWFSAQDTLDYYNRMAAANGGLNAVQAWSRVFLSPGMGHCSGGNAALDRFDMLSALIDWVKTGKAPESVVANGEAFPQRSRPLCAYPRHAHYAGTGNPEDAKNFKCTD